MVVNNWIAANLIWITLVIAIIVLIYFVFTIIQTTRKKRRFVSQLNIILLILGLMFLIFLTYRASEIEGANWGQIILMIGLVAVTAAYASSAEKQADASVEMAEEMRDTRYDALRPIIDIVNMQQMPIELAHQAYAKEPPKELPCKLCNIGVGPATDVYSFVYHDSGERRRRSLDTIVIGKETGPERLSLAQKDDHWFLVAYYKDVYGRWFESSREVRLGAVNPDPLQIRQIPEEELPK